MLALLVASLVIAFLMGVLTRLDGTWKESFAVFGLTAFFAPIYGFIPGFLVTGLSDWLSPRSRFPRETTALVIHMFGGALFLWFAGPYFGWLGVVAALLFWWVDERLKPSGFSTSRHVVVG
ncbi:hypothetical protein DC3_14910 [Deinococcus cellulosilyticus NBRC 106333 = KACC 11606]|uniref:Uncharacterized protein n=1 Tax=Deinococcus cellulosilyticus (strain DSM 18568 / NBRC 106333 / KACC 11606 / 5516J-15) TaxID=1223518 RepID=A0A511N0E7_DEIC1|nr:hypothetical protein DC3_14910 [Deinococcus cellulosilyticus NBRC 106333 = KACC 11606]